MQEWIHALYFTLFKNIYEYVTFFPVKIQSQNYQLQNAMYPLKGIYHETLP